MFKPARMALDLNDIDLFIDDVQAHCQLTLEEAKELMEEAKEFHDVTLYALAKHIPSKTYNQYVENLDSVVDLLTQEIQRQEDQQRQEEMLRVEAAMSAPQAWDALLRIARARNTNHQVVVPVLQQPGASAYADGGAVPDQLVPGNAP